MANQHADGSMIVDTQLDTKGFKADSAELQRAVKSLNNKVEGLGPTFQKACSGNAGAISQFKEKASSLKDTIASIEERMSELGSKEYNTNQYEALTEEIKKGEQELEKLIAKQKELEAGKLGEYNRQKNAIIADTDKNLPNAITDEQTKNLLSMEQYALEQLDSKYSDVISKAEEYSTKIQSQKQHQDELNAKLAEMQNAGKTTISGEETAEYQYLNEQLNAAKASLAEMQGSGRRVTAQFSKSAQFCVAVREATQKIGATLKGVVQSGIKRMTSGFKNAGKQITQMRKKLTRMALVMIGMRGVMGMIRQLATSAREQNEQLANQLDAIKGVVGSAFTPIISAIIGGLSTIISFIDRIYSAFTGISLIAKYNAKQAKEMAKGTSGAAKAAKEYKRQLAGFDELNVLSDSSSDGGGGGGSSVKTFEEPEMSPFLDSLIEQIKAGDWYGVGATIADAINNTLAEIDWTDIQSKVNSFCTNLGTAVNGFVDTLDWALVGDSAAQAINTITGAVNSFVDTVDWQSAGEGIGDALNALVEGVDGEALGKTLSAKLKILTETLYGFFKTFDAKALGKKIGGIVNAWFANIDWEHVGSNVSSLIKTLFDLGSGFLASLDEKKLAQDIKDFFKGIDWKGVWDSIVGFVKEAVTSIDEFLTALFGEEGAAIIEGLAIAIAAVVTALTAFSVVMGVVNAVMSVSPVTWIILGIVAAIAAVIAIIILCVKHWDEIKEALSKFGEKLKEVGGKIKTWLTDKLNALKDFMKTLPDKIKQGIGNLWGKIKEKFTTFWTNLKSWFNSKWESIKGFGSSIVNKIKTGLGNVWNTIKEKFTTFWTNIKDWFSSKWESIKGFGSSIISKIKTGIGNVWGTIKEKFTAFWTNLKDWFSGKWESVKNFGTTIITKIKSGIGNVWNTIKEKFTTFWTNLKSWFSNKVESFKKLGSNIIAGIKNGIKDKISEIKTALTDGLSSALGAVKKLLGIHSPSRVFRDEVGANIDAGLVEGIEENAPSLLRSASDVANAVTEEFQNGEYSISPVTVDTANIVANGMRDFSNIITEGFTDLMNRLHAIAEGVTFTVPVAASGIVPYSSRTDYNSREIVEAIFSSNDELESVIAQLVGNGTNSIVSAIRESNKGKGISKTDIGDAAIDEINRRTIILGRSPIKQ